MIVNLFWGRKWYLKRLAQLDGHIVSMKNKKKHKERDEIGDAEKEGSAPECKRE